MFHPSPTAAERNLASVKEQIRKLLVDIWNVPNVLTMIRLILVPVFVIVYISGNMHGALVVFCIASLTDFLDGRIARHFHLITSFGKLMDPLADKLMVCSALICLVCSGIFPWIAFAVVAAKELTMVIGSAYMLKQGIVVHSNILGKAAQCSFIAAMILGFFHQDFLAIGILWDQIILWISVVICLCALADYTLMAKKQLKKTK